MFGPRKQTSPAVPSATGAPASSMIFTSWARVGSPTEPILRGPVKGLIVVQQVPSVSP